MKLLGKREWGGPIDLPKLWQMIRENTTTLIKCVPDTSDIRQIGPNEFEFKISIHMGPVRGVFNANVKITEINESTGKITMILNSKGPGATLVANVVAQIDNNGVSYDADANLTGLLAAVGERLIRSYIEGKLNDFLNNVVKLARTGQC